ncbi:histidine kinase-like ATPase [Mycena galopus ATCC 62051]|nr:histidine kinase-like ATPase [Mycena galopus ATCC 62051]
MDFLRTYTASSTAGYAYSGSDGKLQYLLPPQSEAHIAIPLFSNGQPALLLLVSTKKPLHIYEPADVSFASTFATLYLGSLAKIKLIKADAAKTAFVSMISHELRTPLHGLLSQLELIREFAPKEFLAETEWFLQAAEVCGLTLRDVVNDVLDFGKQEHGSGDLQAYYTEADLSVLAIEAMSVAYGRRRQWETVSGASESAVEVYVAIEDFPTGWGAMIDVGGLRRVLLNLASNALKYTPKGSITLSLRQLAMQPVDKSSNGQRLIEFSMKDTGIGMSSEYKDDIFTPFSQESTFNPGTGLGMSISETILARLGGEFLISSDLGKGTTVTFTLPIKFMEARPVRTETDSPRTVTKTLISHDDLTLFERSPSRRPTPTPTSPPAPLAKSEVDPQPLKKTGIPRSPLRQSTPELQSGAADFRVLVVEDNHIGRKILTTLLTRKGVFFREAADGLAALTVYREFLPHLVWTDVSMPVMDGVESARRMRMIENELQLHPAHIVALTGHSSHGEMEEALLGEASLDEWLIKGHANLKTLISGLEKVQRTVRRRHSGNLASTTSAPAPV